MENSTLIIELTQKIEIDLLAHFKEVGRNIPPEEYSENLLEKMSSQMAPVYAKAVEDEIIKGNISLDEAREFLKTCYFP